VPGPHADPRRATPPHLAERVVARGRGSDEDRAGLAIELETAAAALEQVAAVAVTAGDNDALLARALYARFATERAIERAVMSAAAAAGGMAFIESPEIAYLLGGHPCPGLPPVVTGRRRGPDRPLPRRRPADALTSCPLT